MNDLLDDIKEDQKLTQQIHTAFKELDEAMEEKADLPLMRQIQRLSFIAGTSVGTKKSEDEGPLLAALSLLNQAMVLASQGLSTEARRLMSLGRRLSR